MIRSGHWIQTFLCGFEFSMGFWEGISLWKGWDGMGISLAFFGVVARLGYGLRMVRFRMGCSGRLGRVV